jgi:hypothetical protein
MNFHSILPYEQLIGLIAEFSGELHFIEVLGPFMHPNMFKSFFPMKRKKLIYGEVQSGKTANIIQELTKATTLIPMILIIQNSLMVKKQYESRLKDFGISFQTIDRKTNKIDKPVVILMNNPHQMKKYNELNGPDTYSLLLDESDITRKHPLVQNALTETHITATPFNRQYYKQFFDEIHFIERNPDYYGLDKVTLREAPLNDQGLIDIFAVVQDFLQSPTGMLLINHISRIQNMHLVAKRLSITFPDIPIVVMTSNKRVYLNQIHTTIKEKKINIILDRFNSNAHVIIFANRLSTRGISYTNSDYSRHITHQLSKCTSSTGFLQKCRIFGIYKDHPKLTIYLHETLIPKAQKIQKLIANQNQITIKCQKNQEDIVPPLYQSNIPI